jgi:hypothetical protein
MAAGIHRTDHTTLFYLLKLALTSLPSGGLLVSIVRVCTLATELLLLLVVVVVVVSITEPVGDSISALN